MSTAAIIPTTRSPKLTDAILLAEIRPSKTNPRKNFSGAEFDELVASIKEHGVLQPVLLRPQLTGGGFELVCGERRYRAALKAGLKEIPAVFRDLTDEQAIELQIVENLQRQDVSPLEEAEGYVKLVSVMSEGAVKYPRQKIIDEIAQKVGKSTRYIYARMKLAELAPEVKTAIGEGKLSASHGDELVRLPQAAQKKVVGEVLAVPGEAPSIRDFKKAIKQTSARTADLKPCTSADIERDLLDAVSRDVSRDIKLRIDIRASLPRLSFVPDSRLAKDLHIYASSLERDARLCRALLKASEAKRLKPSAKAAKKAAKKTTKKAKKAGRR